MSELERIEADLVHALTTIRTHWPALLEQGAGGNVGAPSADVVNGLDRRVSLRHEVTLCLNGWARVIVEDRDLSHGLPLGTDTLGLCELIERHARWFSGHEAAQDAVDELATWADEVRKVAVPKRRDWVYLGDCPFVVEDWFCHGQVRAYTDPDRLPSCSDCGQEAVVEWWEEVLDVARTVPRDDLATFIGRHTGRKPSRVTLWRWIKGGIIVSCGLDEEGREVFDRGAVVFALVQRAG